MGVYLDAAMARKDDPTDYGSALAGAIKKAQQGYGQKKFEQNLPNYSSYLQASQDPNMSLIYGPEGANAQQMDALKLRGSYDNALMVKMAGEPDPELERIKAYNTFRHNQDTIGPALTDSSLPSYEDWLKSVGQNGYGHALNPAPVGTESPAMVAPPIRPPNVSSAMDKENLAISNLIKTGRAKDRVTAKWMLTHKQGG